jgi:aspartyl-tRNA(Asn)/glutamyl-tRNA(Gln) amidotransferase subunit C
VSEPTITLAQVQHVARLARLELDAAELERMRGELEVILEYVRKLSRVDTAGVEPTAHVVASANVLREDEVRPSYPVDAMLANAPDPVGDHVRVPRILEE